MGRLLIPALISGGTALLTAAGQYRSSRPVSSKDMIYQGVANGVASSMPIAVDHIFRGVPDILRGWRIRQENKNLELQNENMRLQIEYQKSLNHSPSGTLEDNAIQVSTIKLDTNASQEKVKA